MLPPPPSVAASDTAPASPAFLAEDVFAEASVGVPIVTAKVVRFVGPPFVEASALPGGVFAAAPGVFSWASSVVERFLELDPSPAEPLPLAPPAMGALLAPNVPFPSAGTFGRLPLAAAFAADMGFLTPPFEEGPVLPGGAFATFSVGFLGSAPVVGPFLELGVLATTPPAAPAAVASAPFGEAPALLGDVFSAAFTGFFPLPVAEAFLKLGAL